MIADRFREDALRLLRELPELEGVDVETLLAIPPRPEQGDYALPAFTLAKKLGTSPAKIATRLAERAASLLPGYPMFSEVEAAGPFLNLSVSPRVRAEATIRDIRAAGERYGWSDRGQGRVVMVDFSSPNIAKPFGIGHLRSTVIGSAVCNLYRAQGFEPVGVNHLGDWGKQFGMLMVALEDLPDGMAGLDQAEDPVDFLFKLYVDVHRRAEEDPGIEDRARAWFKRLEQGDREARAIWQRCVDVSMAEFRRIYRLLGVEHNITHYWGESHYEGEPMARVVRELEAKGLLEESEDAKVVFMDDDLPPCLILKSDGTTLYATRDIAAAIYRQEVLGAWRLVYVVGAPQALHFKQVFQVLRKMGYDWADNCVHVPFGLIRFPDGAMSTRKGKIVLLKEVLDRSVELVRKIIADRDYPEEEKERVARQVGIGAVIFADLSASRIKDWEFEWDELLNFNGRTGPYLQYTHARLGAVLRKYGEPVPSDFDPDRLLDAPSQSLLRALGRFPDTVSEACEQHEPSMVSRYLLDLAEALNTFYNANRIIDRSDPDTTGARVALVHAVRTVLGNGLGLLGIPIPERM